jgi:hypothetical protein
MGEKGNTIRNKRPRNKSQNKLKTKNPIGYNAHKTSQKNRATQQRKTKKNFDQDLR